MIIVIADQTSEPAKNGKCQKAKYKTVLHVLVRSPNDHLTFAYEIHPLNWWAASVCVYANGMTAASEMIALTAAAYRNNTNAFGSIRLFAFHAILVFVNI